MHSFSMVICKVRSEKWTLKYIDAYTSVNFTYLFFKLCISEIENLHSFLKRCCITLLWLYFERNQRYHCKVSRKLKCLNFIKMWPSKLSNFEIYSLLTHSDILSFYYAIFSSKQISNILSITVPTWEKKCPVWVQVESKCPRDFD